MSCYLTMRRLLPVVACSATLLVTGCAFTGGSAISAGGSGASSLSQGNMRGVARGGRQGIYNATVTLYAMSTSTGNYGDTPIQMAQTLTTDSNGDFAFTKGNDGDLTPVPTISAGNTSSTWSCPAGASAAAAGSATNPYIYLVAAGGDTSGAGTSSSNYNNSFSKLMVVLGSCSSLSTGSMFTVNEATTVASMVALQQFFNPMTQAIGSKATNVVGLTNAISMIGNLVNPGTGVMLQAFTPATGVPGATVTVTPEYQKLNTMANILASCVSSNPNSSAGACNALVANAVPPTFAPPATLGGQAPGAPVTSPVPPSTCSPSPCADPPSNTNPPYNAVATESAAVTNFPTITTYPAVADVLQAIDYMLINPTESQDYLQGTGKLYNLYTAGTSGTPPFSPALTAQPSDWTVGIGFVPGGGCHNLHSIAITLVTTPPSPPTTPDVTFMNGEYGMAVDKIGNIWMGGSGGSGSTSYDVLGELSPTGIPINCLSSASSGTTMNTAGRRIAID
ncbi:MAG: hypothetical protein ABI142_05495, partial [Bryocella sp.]